MSRRSRKLPITATEPPVPTATSQQTPQPSNTLQTPHPHSVHPTQMAQTHNTNTSTVAISTPSYVTHALFPQIKPSLTATTLRKVYAAQEHGDLDAATDKYVAGILLMAKKVKPSENQDYGYLKRSNNGVKKRSVNSPIKRLYLFASPDDDNNECFYVFEHSQDDRRKYWLYDTSLKLFRPGAYISFHEPKIEGEMPNGTLVVSVSMPLRILKIPQIRVSRPINTDLSTKNQRYFMLLNCTLKASKKIDLVPTNCTGTTCDRLEYKSDTCACYSHQQLNGKYSNVFLMAHIELLPHDTDKNKGSQNYKISDFTSLTTTKLLHKNQKQALFETNVLLKNPDVLELFRDAWHTTTPTEVGLQSDGFKEELTSGTMTRTTHTKK